MPKTRVLGLALAVTGLLVSLFINYHSFLTDFNLVPGDLGDTRLVVFTLEHWLSVFKGHEAFYVLNMFYPDRLALGYADGLFLFAFPYAVFRLLGLDYFTSYQLLFVFMTAFGYLGCLLLLEKGLGLDRAFAVLGAVLLTSLNAVQYQAQIGKMLGFYFYPVLIGALLLYARNDSRSGWKAWVSLVVFAGGLGLLFFTSYYPAWFLVFTLLVFAAVEFAAGCLRQGIGITLRNLLGFVKRHWVQIAVTLGVLIVSLIPFGVTYAPLVLSDSNRSFSLVLGFTPTLRDVINVSNANYVWSPLLRWAGFKFGDREVQLGSPLIVLAIFLVYYVWTAVRRLRRGPSGTSARDWHVFLLATTAFVLAALIIKFHDTSLWYAVYSLVPGASALRALGRYLTIVDMIVVVTAVYAMNAAYRAARLRPNLGPLVTNTGFIALSVLLIVEQANGASYRLDKAGQLAFLSRYDEPGINCKAFFINDAPSSNLPIGYYQLDAMMISMRLGIPTVNGYSGFSPDAVFNMVPAGVEYKYLILKWLHAHAVEQGICELDYATTAFQSVNLAADLPRYEQLNRENYLQTFSTLLAASRRFLSDKNSLSNLTPQYLEERGYLDPTLGYETGPGYRWIQDRLWLGERACGRTPCFGVGIVGTYNDVRGIIDAYGPQALQIFFPNPEPWTSGKVMPGDVKGELLLVFPAQVPP